MNAILIKLPVKPLSINAAFQGRRFKTKECSAYCSEVLKRLPSNQSMGGYVEIYFRFYLKNWKMTDGDNLVKVLTDCIVQKGIIDDDRFIMRYVIEKYPAKTDSIEVDIVRFNEKEKADGTI